MSAFNQALAKLRYELVRCYLHLKYPFVKNAVLSRVSANLSRINIETTNVCNANCVFCAYQFQTRPRGVMKEALFRSIVDQFSASGGSHISLTPTVGEPLADPQILSRIAYARSKPEINSISMYSNMILAARVGIEELVDSGLTSLSVSTSGFDEAMYERVYRSNQFEQMIENVKEFARANNQRNRPVRFSVNMRVDDRVNQVTKNPVFKEIESLVGGDRINIKLRYDNWAGKIKQSDLSGKMQLRGSKFGYRRVSACSQLYGGLVIYWDGKVGACAARDVDARELIVGDATKVPIAEIWQGREIQKLREEFLTPRIKSICNTCTHYTNGSELLRKGIRK